MYIPSHFAGNDQPLAEQLIDQHPFATLVTPPTGANDQTWISHLPLLVRRHGQALILLGHMARANGHWRSAAVGASVAIFHGPQGYISPHWYTSADMVPTWNYAVVHAHGRIQLRDDAALTRDIVWQLSERFEAPLPNPWRPQAELDRGLEDKMLTAIVGFEMPIERLEVKVKMGQNRLPVDQQSMLAALAEQPQSAALLALMRQTLQR